MNNEKYKQNENWLRDDKLFMQYPPNRDDISNRLVTLSVSEVEELLFYKCQILQNIIEDNNTYQYDDLMYFISNYVLQNLSLQIKLQMKQQESNSFIINHIPKEDQSTYCNFYLLIKNKNKKIRQQFIVLAGFMDQLFKDAIDKFFLEGDEFLEEWLDQKLALLQQQQPDLVIDIY